MQASRRTDALTVVPTPPDSNARPRSSQVLYVHPAKQGVDPTPDAARFDNPSMILPMGVIALVNLLRSAGHSVRGINHPLEVALNSRIDLEKWLRGHPEVQFILIDLHWHEHAYGAIQVARVARKCHPGAWIILGGADRVLFR